MSLLCDGWSIEGRPRRLNRKLPLDAFFRSCNSSRPVLDTDASSPTCSVGCCCALGSMVEPRRSDEGRAKRLPKSLKMPELFLRPRSSPLVSIGGPPIGGLLIGGPLMAGPLMAGPLIPGSPVAARVMAISWERRPGNCGPGGGLVCELLRDRGPPRLNSSGCRHAADGGTSDGLCLDFDCDVGETGDMGRGTPIPISLS